jgi:hypothetical protein
MDCENKAVAFETLKQSITLFKSFMTQLTNSKQLSLDSGVPTNLLKELETHGVASIKMPGDSDRLFRVFSYILYSTPRYVKKIKFAFNSFVANYESDISDQIKSFYAEDFMIEKYMSDFMVDKYDFEVTFTLLCVMYNINADIYFQ